MVSLTRYNETVDNVIDVINDILSDLDYPKNIYRYVDADLVKNPILYKETKTGIEVTFQVPGYGKEDLQLSYLNGGTLIVENKENRNTLKLQTRLSKKINTDTLNAKCEKGILIVTAQYLESDKKLINIE